MGESRTKWGNMRFHHTTQDNVQLKTYDLFTSKIFHLIFSDQSWPRVTETTHSEAANKRGLLYMKCVWWCFMKIMKYPASFLHIVLGKFQYSDTWRQCLEGITFITVKPNVLYAPGAHHPEPNLPLSPCAAHMQDTDVLSQNGAFQTCIILLTNVTPISII